jgi:glycine/D-amino acid oxidase-like deaminating enzyme
MNNNVNANKDIERQCVMEQVLGATTLAEIDAAKQVLRNWLKLHPEEQGMRAGFEQLYLLEEIAQEQNAEAVAVQHGCEGIIDFIPRYFPAFQPADFRDLPIWSGLRPCSPDGLPYIGRFGRYANLSAATGHAMMGLSPTPPTTNR